MYVDPTVLSALLFGMAALFAVVNGVNDGSVLVANGLKISTLRPLVALSMATTALLLTPVLLGTRVAATLARGLVTFEGTQGALTFAGAIAGTVVVVLALSRIGLPTSLTLALIGGISGAGLAFGLPVSWNVIGFVLLMGALAPVAGGLSAYALSRIPGRLPTGVPVGRAAGMLHVVGFGALCVAYGANDGQKMLAAFAITAGAIPRGSMLDLSHLAVIVPCFILGTLVGLRRTAGTLGRGVAPIRPEQAVAAELSSATAVLTTAFVGAPVSMTQAVTGALVGSSLVHGRPRVRWRTVLQIGVAWLCTLPTAAAVGTLFALLLTASIGGD